MSHSPSAMYIHVPFCMRKCLYCDFASYPGKEHLYEPYVRALRKEIGLSAARFPKARISTIYVGGGTPNVLSPDQLALVLHAVNTGFQVNADAEITLESNPSIRHQPSTINHQPLSFTRLSLGVQSLHDNELEALGRIHTAEEAIRAFHTARDAGFRNISLDLMYGIPGQTRESWRETLQRVLDLGPEHISLYSLSIEEGTPFFEMRCEGRLELPGNDIEADVYETAISTLTQAGFVHYEISNFARPCFESRHNTSYWRNEPYFGFGAGASSYLDGVRATNVREVEEYIRRIESGENAVDFEERPTTRTSMGETMFLGLRMLEGVDVHAFTCRFGLAPQEVFGTEIVSLTQRGLIEESGERVRLTRKGLLLANEVFAEFVE